jgi:flagellar biosynthesis component FlhA
LVEETRRREAYNFESSTTVYQAVSRAVEEALQILEEIWSGDSSFIQLAKHMNGLLKSAVKIRKVHLLAGVMSALSQLATKDL